MATWIALFRGINVGGNKILRMKELVLLFEELDFEEVRTYIQSGNVVFRARDTSTKKSRCVSRMPSQKRMVSGRE